MKYTRLHQYEWNGINLLLELTFLEQRFMRYHRTSSGNWPAVFVTWLHQYHNEYYNNKNIKILQ